MFRYLTVFNSTTARMKLIINHKKCRDAFNEHIFDYPSDTEWTFFRATDQQLDDSIIVFKSTHNPY